MQFLFHLMTWRRPRHGSSWELIFQDSKRVDEHSPMEYWGDAVVDFVCDVAGPNSCQGAPQQIQIGAAVKSTPTDLWHG